MNVSKAKTATIMNKFTIQQLQQMRESEDRVEFKAGEGGNVSYDGRGKTNPKDRRRCILGYVIALCNEGGGRLVIGVHDNYPHRVTGTCQSQDAIGKLESDIYRDTTIRPEIYELYDEEKRRVLVIEVPSRPIGKVFKFEDVPLMRVGEELKPMSDAMYLKILQESEPDFSEKICEGLSLEDLDEEAIRVMKQGYAQRWNKPEFVSTPTLQVLHDFALMNKGGQLTNAALILLGKSEAIRKHLYCDRVIVEYRLYHSMIEYTARQEFQEPLVLMVDSVWNYINQPASNPLQHYNDGFRIGDIPTFNRDVVREAILNACCHRVMYIQSDVVIKQYPDQLIITNAGGFPVGVDVDNILTVNSMPRCKLITEVLQKAGFIEKSGQGVDKMFYHCLMDGKCLPDYSLTDEWQVCLRLPGEIRYPAFMLYARELQNARPANNKLNVFDLLALFRASQGESQRHTDEVTIRKLIDEGLLIPAQDGYKLAERYYEIVKNVGTVEDNRKNDTVNVPVNDTVKLSQLTERQKRIYHIIKDGTIKDTANDIVNDTVTAKTLSESLGTSIITIKRDLAAMQSMDVIKRVGSDKTGHWEVTD